MKTFIKINNEDVQITEKDLSNFISNAMYSYNFNWFGAAIHQVYNETKHDLLREGFKAEEIWCEDVYARMLLTGEKLICYDSESNEKHEFGLNEIVSGLNKYFEELPANGCSNLEELINEGDSEDADCVMQYAIYGELIYG